MDYSLPETFAYAYIRRLQESKGYDGGGRRPAQNVASAESINPDDRASCEQIAACRMAPKTVDYARTKLPRNLSNKNPDG